MVQHTVESECRFYKLARQKMQLRKKQAANPVGTWLNKAVGAVGNAAGKALGMGTRAAGAVANTAPKLLPSDVMARTGFGRQLTNKVKEVTSGAINQAAEDIGAYAPKAAQPYVTNAVQAAGNTAANTAASAARGMVDAGAVGGALGVAEGATRNASGLLQGDADSWNNLGRSAYQGAITGAQIGGLFGGSTGFFNRKSVVGGQTVPNFFERALFSETSPKWLQSGVNNLRQLGYYSTASASGAGVGDAINYAAGGAPDSAAAQGLGAAGGVLAGAAVDYLGRRNPGVALAQHIFRDYGPTNWYNTPAQPSQDLLNRYTPYGHQTPQGPEAAKLLPGNNIFENMSSDPIGFINSVMPYGNRADTRRYSDVVSKLSLIPGYGVTAENVFGPDSTLGQVGQIAQIGSGEGAKELFRNLTDYGVNQYNQAMIDGINQTINQQVADAQSAVASGDAKSLGEVIQKTQEAGKDVPWYVNSDQVKAMAEPAKLRLLQNDQLVSEVSQSFMQQPPEKQTEMLGVVVDALPEGPARNIAKNSETQAAVVQTFRDVLSGEPIKFDNLFSTIPAASIKGNFTDPESKAMVERLFEKTVERTKKKNPTVYDLFETTRAEVVSGLVMKQKAEAALQNYGRQFGQLPTDRDATPQELSAFLEKLETGNITDFITREFVTNALPGMLQNYWNSMSPGAQIAAIGVIGVPLIGMLMGGTTGLLAGGAVMLGLGLTGSLLSTADLLVGEFGKQFGNMSQPQQNATQAPTGAI